MIEAICPISMNGGSTGFPPIQVRISVLATKDQNRICERGRNVMLRCFAVCSIGNTIRIKMDMSNAMTPPNLFGIDRKMA